MNYLLLELNVSKRISLVLGIDLRGSVKKILLVHDQFLCRDPLDQVLIENHEPIDMNLLHNSFF